MGATQRMFVALYPSKDVIEEITQLLEPRPQCAWTPPEQWHLTLAFLPAVPLVRIDELIERLGETFARRRSPRLRLEGASAFPSPERARVLYLRPLELEGSLAPLARTARNTANACGATPDGRRFVPHLTVARLPRGQSAERWLAVLRSFVSSPWTARSAHLMASHLGRGVRGRARHEEVARFPLTSAGGEAGPGTA
ncbi:MAG: RNA 2',3'-cyclic phosphodiesterase [Bowdeniella nasicola]|nr:RNA 2',3'-cyclic phosphodiesterase [Bowdeniella nasicola]